MIYLLCVSIGVIAGLRALTAPAAVAWAAWLGFISLDGTILAFLGSPWAVGILTALALAELVADQLPTTPSRKVPVQFGTRLLTGALAGGAIGAAHGLLEMGAVAGIVGAVIGTLGGAWARGRLAAAFGKDRPAALIEDAVAILGALVIIHLL